MIQVLLADDHAVMRRGIRDLLETDPEIEVTGEAMDGRDVRVVERRKQPRLSFEAGAAVGVGEPGSGEHFNRDVAPEPRITSAIDLAHPARAKQADHLVGPDATARDRHVSGADLTPFAAPLIYRCSRTTGVKQSPLLQRWPREWRLCLPLAAHSRRPA